MIDLNKAKYDPASIFKSPRDVLNDHSLSNSLKIDILKRWAYEEREMEVAEEENMRRANDDHHADILDEILKCLLELDVDSEQLSQSPTKQG
jgi:hypothetical protein